MKKKDKSTSPWSAENAGDYEQTNYGTGLSAFVMRSSHALIEKEFGDDAYFSRVLEVGAGSGVHVNYVRHRFDEYTMSDASEAMLRQIKTDRLQPGKNITTSVQDATKLSFPDASVDRLIATHVLEHIYRPHEALSEWMRVVKPGGIISLVLPCDPGFAWRMGRHFGPRKKAQEKNLPYDYIMALEHVNSIGNLTAIIKHMTELRTEYWWPFGLPSQDINLIYGVNIRRR